MDSIVTEWTVLFRERQMSSIEPSGTARSWEAWKLLMISPLT